jgi:hypothetical protein
MKTILGILATLALGTSMANADVTVQLANIDTNSPNFAQKEVSLLNGTAAYVDAQVEGPAQYSSNNGNVYSYRVYTSVTVSGDVAPGSQVKLAFIDTNDCARAQSEINLLNSAAVPISTECLGPGSYASNNGRTYAYRLVTYLTIPSQN